MTVRRSPTLARQAAGELMDGIRRGALAGDDGLLPSETALSARLGVSRATLREALSQLEHAGFIVRRHGIGTFVSERRPVMDSGLEELESIETLARRTGVEIHMAECDIRERDATPVEVAALEVSPEGGPTPVISFERVIMSGERAIAFLVDVVPADLLDPRRLRESFDGSVLDLLLRRGDPPLHHSWTELSSQATDALLARSLGLRKGDPLLRLTARLYSTDGRVVDYSESYFTSGHFRFHVIRRVGTLAPAPWQRDPGMQEVHAMAAAAVDS